MSIKASTANLIAIELAQLLGYGNKTEEAMEAGIDPELFDSDDTSKLREAIKEALLEIRIIPPFRQHLEQLLSEAADLPFEKTAEYWEMVVLLLKYIDWERKQDKENIH